MMNCVYDKFPTERNQVGLDLVMDNDGSYHDWSSSLGIAALDNLTLAADNDKVHSVFWKMVLLSGSLYSFVITQSYPAYPDIQNP
jgi:hypothetical protein